MSRCRGCGADVYFATTTATGKAMPLDPNPTTKGNIVLEKFTHAEKPKARVLSGLELQEARENADRSLYTSHFATCPHAGQFRTKPTPTPDNVIPITRGRS